VLAGMPQQGEDALDRTLAAAGTRLPRSALLRASRLAATCFGPAAAARAAYFALRDWLKLYSTCGDGVGDGLKRTPA
jgi:hypothetical protein